MCVLKCVCVAFVAVAGRRYTYTVCTDQVIRENPANRGTETSAEVLVGPPWRTVCVLLTYYYPADARYNVPRRTLGTGGKQVRLDASVKTGIGILQHSSWHVTW